MKTCMLVVAVIILLPVISVCAQEMPDEAVSADAILQELVSPEATDAASAGEETSEEASVATGDEAAVESTEEEAAAVPAELAEGEVAEPEALQQAAGAGEVSAETEGELPAGESEAVPDEAAAAPEVPAEEELIEIGLEKPAPPGVEVTPSEAEKNLISLSLDNVPLQDVIRMFTRISGANIVAGTNLQGTVTVSLQDVEWQPALMVILDSVDMTMVEKAPGIYVIMSKEEMATEPVTVETIQLKYTTVSNILPIVQRMLISTNASVAGFPSANSIVVQETASQISKIRETINRLDVPRPQVFIEAKFVELNDQAIKDLGIKWQVLQGYTIGVSAPRFAWARGRTKREETDEYSTRSARDSTSRRYTDSYTWKRNENHTYANKWSERTSFGLTNGIPGFEYGWRDDSSDDASGNIERTREIRDVSQSLSESLAESGRQVTRSVLTTTEELLSAILTADDFAITLSALKQNNGVDIISNPRIIVASGETATIHVGVQEPNIQAKPQGDVGNVYVYGLDEGQRFFDVGVKVSVTPTVNTEERITVRIEPELSRLLAPAKVEQVGIEFPRIQTRKITTEFNIPSGRTVAIGGLTQTSDREEVSKIPVLGDIPIIGKYLFSHRHTRKEQDEVIIFVTVGMAAADELTQVSGIPSGGRLIHERMAREKAGGE